SNVDEASKKDLEYLFQDFYGEYFDSSKIMKSSTTNVETPINEEVFHEVSESFQGESSLSSLNDDVQQSPEECNARRTVGNKMHKAFPLLVRKFPLSEGTSHCLKKNTTTRRKVLPLPEVCTAIIVKEKPLVKDDSFL
nr:hypothetical protein [Tanacetum cinerariifolium]